MDEISGLLSCYAVDVSGNHPGLIFFVWMIEEGYQVTEVCDCIGTG
jgi:hypothetical protein